MTHYYTPLEEDPPMPALSETTFEYLKPTDQQMADMGHCRQAVANYADVIESFVPDGADKTYLLRKLREVAMWVNIALTRNTDGSPRDE